jgi:cysteine synthase A
MSKINQSISELVGKTPLLQLNGYAKKHSLNADIIGKLEYFNPNQSVKDRIALSMIEDAEQKGLLKKGDTIVETTSGNTGIGLAAIAAAKGYPFKVYIQDQVSEERFKVIQAFGGKTIKFSDDPVISRVLAETNGDFVEAIKAYRAEVLSKEKNVYFVDQTANPANPAAHKRTTGPEIWEDTDGQVDILVACVGTGGTVSGTGAYLKEKNLNIKIVAVQPGKNSLPSDENPAPEEITGVHPFEGVPAERVPKTMDLSIYDEKIEVETEEAYKAAREVAKSDGILIGTSSGAALHAATLLAQREENKGKKIVVIFPDTGLRYLSTNLFA